MLSPAAARRLWLCSSHLQVSVQPAPTGGAKKRLKVFISVDIEGVAGSAHGDEAAKTHADYAQFAERMTAEAVAACEGAIAAGATEIWVKDAHGSGRNIMQERLPKEATLVRGWSGHPFAMVQELDSSFDAVCMIGYHGAASDPQNPLSHTYSGSWNHITLNDELCPEYWLYAHCAALEGVPVAYISGDAGICAFAERMNPSIGTNVTNTGHGDSVIAVSPALARDRIAEGVKKALESDLSAHVLPSAEHYKLKLRFQHHGDAYRCQFYPRARLEGSQTVVVESETFTDIASVFQFF